MFGCVSDKGTGLKAYSKTPNGKTSNALAADTSALETSESSSTAQSTSMKRVDKKLLTWWKAKIFECRPNQLSNMLDLTCAKASSDIKATENDSINKDCPSDVSALVHPAEDTKLAIVCSPQQAAVLVKSALEAVDTNCASPTPALDVFQALKAGLLDGTTTKSQRLKSKSPSTNGASSGIPSSPSVTDPMKNPQAEHLRKYLSTRGPALTRGHKVPSRLFIDLDYDEGSCLTSIPSESAAQHFKRIRSSGNLSSKSIDSTDAEVWEEIAKASLVVETAIKSMMPGHEAEQKSAAPNIGLDIEHALEILQFHADRLGVKESDLLLAVKSNDSTENMSAAVQSKQPSTKKDDADNISSLDPSVPSALSLTLGEEILEAFKMYIKDSKIA